MNFRCPRPACAQAHGPPRTIQRLARWATVALPAAILPAVVDAQTVVDSLLKLRAHAGDHDSTIIMAPGEYWITKNGSDRTLLRLSGDNTTYDFSQATFKVDTRNFDGFGGGHANTVNVLGLYGANSTVTGLDLEALDVDLDTEPQAQRWADAPATNMVRISGSGNRLEHSSIVARGSNTYGYGDAFGKGGSPCSGCANIPPHKGLGIQVLDAAGTTQIDHLDLQMRAFGHGIYIQETDGLVDIRNTNVVGELADSQDVIDHPVYQATITPEYPQGRTHYGPAMWEGIEISKSEDGIRTYGTTSAELYLENTMVENMREAYSLFSTSGTATVINAAAWDNETGFEPGAGDVILNSRASATNGPMLYMRQDNVNDTEIEIELHADRPQPGRDWNVAIISGERNRVTFTEGDIAPGALADDSMVRLSQRYIDWRHLPGLPDSPVDNGRTTRDLSIVNTTGQNLVLGSPAFAGSNNYDISSGNTLGGSGSIFAAASGPDVDIRLLPGGKLDPVGTLSISAGLGDLELAPGVNDTNTQALLFHLDGESNSDKLQTQFVSRLNIGDDVLEFDDFVFSTSPQFAGGIFPLLQSSMEIFGSLGSNLSGTVAGLAAELTISDDGKSVLLTIEPQPVLAGDYNDDGMVNAADYTVWRDHLGGANLANETASLGIVDAADYQVWKANFGAELASAAAGIQAIPEPAGLSLVAAVAGIAAGWPRRRPAGHRCRLELFG